MTSVFSLAEMLCQQAVPLAMMDDLAERRLPRSTVTRDVPRRNDGSVLPVAEVVLQVGWLSQSHVV